MNVPTLVGRSHRARLTLLAMTTALVSGLAAPALAESAHPALDANGVDLVDGSFNLRLPIASVGAGEATLPLIVYDSDTDNWSGIKLYRTLSGGVTTLDVSLARGHDSFTSADGYAASRVGTGATLTVHNNEWVTYQTLDGTRIEFRNPAPNDTGGTSHLCDTYNTSPCSLLPDTINRRGGMTETYHWTVVPNCAIPAHPDGPTNCSEYWRISTVSNGAGYQIGWTYVNPTGAPVAAWYRRATAVLANNVVSGSSTVTYAYPATNVMTVTTPGGRTWQLTGISGAQTGVRRPSASADTTIISYTGGAVSSITRDGVTTSYSRSVSGTTATTVITDAMSHATTVVADLTRQRITSTTNALSQTTSFSYDTVGRPTAVTYPEGNKVQYAYDARGNLTTTTQVPKTGSGLANLVSSATFPSTCTDAACNEPTTTTDAAGHVTDYGYDHTTGLLTSVTLPAPTTGATRPQTRYTYATTGVAVLTQASTCQTGSAPSCIGTADEVRTTIGYDDNLQPTTLATGAGDGSLTTTTTTAYDAIGNVVTADGPLAGTADTTTYRWGADREQLGVIAADPDGSGPLARMATRTGYNSDGKVVTVETGTVAGTSNSDWTSFTASQGITTTYDANGFAVRQDVTAGGTTYGITQYGYDAAGRPVCRAVRMNTAVFGSPSSNSCEPGTAGSAGPDRVTQLGYDAVDRVTAATSAYGTAAVSTEATSYTVNGRVASVTDGEGNRTGYSYDGFDRPTRTSYPVVTQGAGSSSTTDYEELGYDAAGNVTSRRLRDGQSIAYGYDALDRLVVKTPPTGMRPVYAAYDLIGRLTAARFDSAAGADAVTMAYDALGRLNSQTTAMGGVSRTVGWQYDLADGMTRITHPDGVYFSITRDVLERQGYTTWWTAAGGTVPFFNIGYDSLGRRTYTGRASSQTNYGYDALSRLNALTQNFAGGTGNASASFTYNPADQIASRSEANDSFAWTGAANASTSYSANGRNQYSAIGVSTPTYDGRGNLTGYGGTTWGYNAENRLTSASTSGGTTLTYDPLGRLWRIASSVMGKTDFVYDGAHVAVEYDGDTGGIRRRFFWGPRADEPILQDEGGAMNCSGTRVLHEDERGSIVAAADCNGKRTNVNSDDEYGNPGSGNAPFNAGGRYGYTGQAWLPELGLWFYKNRMYSPSLGRFMQTDPIGYGDGLNLYGYVKADPVNRIDSYGLGDVVVIAERLGLCEREPLNQLCSRSSPGNYAPASPPSDGSGLPDGDAQANPQDIVATASVNCTLHPTDSRCGGLPQNPQPPMCPGGIDPIAFTPQGDTRGDNPRPGGGGYNTDLPGSTLLDAGAVYAGLRTLAGDQSSQTFPDLLRPNIISRSYPSGIQLRLGADLQYRIDIPAGTFGKYGGLRVPETIHFRGGKGNMCPTH